MCEIDESRMLKSSMGIIGGLIILLLLSTKSSAQSLERQSLSSMGASMCSDGIILRQTVGQSSNTYLFIGNGAMLRQGFQQPFFVFDYVDGNEHIDFTVFPNPTDGQITIALAEPIVSYNIRIESLMGSLVKKTDNQTFMVNEIDLYGLLPGIYFITIQSGGRVGTKKIVLTR